MAHDLLDGLERLTAGRVGQSGRSHDGAEDLRSCSPVDVEFQDADPVFRDDPVS